MVMNQMRQGQLVPKSKQCSASLRVFNPDGLHIIVSPFALSKINSSLFAWLRNITEEKDEFVCCHLCLWVSFHGENIGGDILGEGEF